MDKMENPPTMLVLVVLGFSVFSVTPATGSFNQSDCGSGPERSKATQAWDYFDLVKRSSCRTVKESGLTRLPIDFDHSSWRPMANVALKTANYISALLARHNNTVDDFLTDDVLFSLVESNVESNVRIFGSCVAWDRYFYRQKNAFAPYAHRENGTIVLHDLIANYNYFSNDYEWFLELKKKAANYRNTVNISTSILNLRSGATVTHKALADYTDGHWTRPYYDCGGGDIWMVTYSAPILTLETNGTILFRGLATIDIDLTFFDVNQCDCDQNETTGDDRHFANVFRGTHKCSPTTKCQPVQGHGFRRGGYQCHCKDGYFFPDITAKDKFYRGTVVEGLNGNTSSASCLPCAKGCTTCVNARPCWHERQVLMRMIVLGIVGLTIFGILVFCCVIYKFRKYMVLRAASPIFLYVMCFGSGLICLSMVVGYFDATEDTCVLEPWLRYIGITVTYSALLLKTYRIAVIFRVKSAKKVNLTDRVLLRRFIPILAVVICYLVTWTVSARPTPVTMTTIDNLKYNSCRTDWWEYVADSGVFCYLLWGVYLSFLVRNAPSSYNESKHITWAVYNTILFGSSISVIKQVVAVQQGPDVIYIMELIYLQVAVTCMFCLIFVPKFIALYKFHKYGSDMLNERRFQNRTAVMFPFLPMTTVRKSLMDVAVQASPSVLDNELDNSEVQISVVPRQESCVRIDNGVEGMKEDLDHKDQDESDNIATSGNEKTSNDHLPNETLAKNDRKFDTVDNTQPKPTTALNTLHVCQETRRPTSRSGTNLSTFSGDLAKAFDASVINEHKLLKSSASDSGLSTPTAASKKEYGWYVCTGCKLSDGKIHRLRDTINHDALPVHKRQSFPFYVQHTQNKNGLPSFIPRTPCKQTHKRTPAKTKPKLPQYPHLMSKRRNTKMTESEYLN